MEKGTALEEVNNVEGTKGRGREEGQNRDTKAEESVYLEFESHSHNEQFARVVAAVFAATRDPTGVEGGGF